jgi:hypothetical protein
MRRVDFLTRLGQLFLLSVLALTAVLLGRRAVNGNTCNSCPGKGICSDLSDCSTFLSLKDGEKTGR